MPKGIFIRTDGYKETMRIAQIKRWAKYSADQRKQIIKDIGLCVPKKKWAEIVCGFCHVNFYVIPARATTAKFCSKRCRAQFDTTITGRKHPNWKNGNTDEHTLIRHSARYRDWRKAVFDRDDYRCFDCGARNGELGKSIRLEADHIFSFSKYPRLRFMVENGRTLCADCHRNTPTYGSWKRSNLALVNQYSS